MTVDLYIPYMLTARSMTLTVASWENLGGGAKVKGKGMGSEGSKGGRGGSKGWGVEGRGQWYRKSGLRNRGDRRKKQRIDNTRLFQFQRINCGQRPSGRTCCFKTNQSPKMWQPGSKIVTQHKSTFQISRMYMSKLPCRSTNGYSKRSK